VEQRDDLFGNHLALLETHLLHAAQFDGFDNLLGELAAQLVIALAADAEELDLLALTGQCVRLFARETYDGRVERTAKAAFRGADHQQMHLILTGAGEQLGRRAAASDRRGDRAEYGAHALGVR